MYTDVFLNTVNIYTSYILQLPVYILYDVKFSPLINKSTYKSVCETLNEKEEIFIS